MPRVTLTIPVRAFYEEEKHQGRFRGPYPEDGVDEDEYTVPIDLGQPKTDRTSVIERLSSIRVGNRPVRGMLNAAILQQLRAAAEDPENVYNHLKDGKSYLIVDKDSHSMDCVDLNNLRVDEWQIQVETIVDGHPHVEDLLSHPRRGTPIVPESLWNKQGLLPMATLDLHGDCVRQQLAECLLTRATGPTGS